MRLKVELLDHDGHVKRRNRQTREIERALRESASKHGRSVEDMAALMEVILSIPETQRALDQLGLSPEELATWFDGEKAPQFADAIRRLFVP